MKNRVIKFRAWDTDCDCFVDCKNHVIGQLTNDYAGLGSRYIYQQYSGLTDKNGVEIYEGDVRKGEYYCNNEKCTIYNVMKWDDVNACFYWDGREIPDWADNGVIGNIFTHPHLIS